MKSLIYTSVFILSFMLTWAIRKTALKYTVFLDIPNRRSLHTVPTPRGGGIAIALSWYAGITWLFISQAIESNLYYAFLCGILLCIIGLIDDFKGLDFKVKLCFQGIAAVMALYFLKGMHFVDLGYATVSWPTVFTPLAFFGILWMINVFNFGDGIDGYASSEAIFIGLVVCIVFQSPAGLLLSFSCLGFLMWNWQKAKIFMGDLGSTLLGFNVAVLGVYLQNKQVASILLMMIITSVFWFDASITLWRRYRNKERLGVAHRKHAYQRIVLAGFSHQKTVIYAMIINLSLLLLVLLLLHHPEFMVAGVIVNVFVLYGVNTRIDKKKPFEV
jgi:UDP-N-acetylmuramyl pentapeptide phosphotransferase/UDP-N-acetylglucosamine-1-phosphate transferase